MQNRVNKGTGVLLLLCLCLASYTRDGWRALREERLTSRQHVTAQFLRGAAVHVAPQVEHLRAIAVRGIQSEEDARLAELVCGLVAGNVYLSGE